MSEMNIPSGFVEKARFVRAIFTDVEREYDALLRIMTVGFNWVWRKRMLSRIPLSFATNTLDLACGTGLVTFELSRRIEARGLVVGLDLSPAMLVIAGRKKHMLHITNTAFVRAAAEFLPFRDRSFGYVTIGLALRNFGDRISVFRESLRILLTHGWFLSVDFIRPEQRTIWRIYRFHIFHVLPAVARLVSSHWNRTMIYLANTILLSSTPIQISDQLVQAGFRHSFAERITLGVVALVGAQRWSYELWNNQTSSQ
jgi:demethylmenaquinone methyltransferase/2-methoxy-6-polyprenyl-1,4-benzoquinol methylase